MPPLWSIITYVWDNKAVRIVKCGLDPAVWKTIDKNLNFGSYPECNSLTLQRWACRCMFVRVHGNRWNTTMTSWCENAFHIIGFFGESTDHRWQWYRASMCSLFLSEPISWKKCGVACDLMCLWRHYIAQLPRGDPWTRTVHASWQREQSYIDSMLIYCMDIPCHLIVKHEKLSIPATYNNGVFPVMIH